MDTPTGAPSPTGLTTLLFTDIESSTRLWEQDAGRMSRALAAHDAASRAAVEANRGVVVKMTGDGMCAAFDEPLDALNATVLLQKTLSFQAAETQLALRVRAGLHLGGVEHRDRDLFGSSVNRAARIMQAAHGGQVLVSQAVVDHVIARLSAPLSFRDLGAVRLRDLGISEHVYQLVHPDLRHDFPALRSLETIPNNLSQQVTSFIGREREIGEAKALLERARLVTLLGMGGLGKTRLSLQIGADLLENYPDGVWFIDLAPIRDPALVPNAAAQALGMHEEAGRSLMEALCAHLRERELLLILDNCEHLVGACAMLADAFLGSAPKLKLLATSREPLSIGGEQIYRLLPMGTPSRDASPDDLLRSEAGQLFLERARLHLPSFALTEREAPAVAELCFRLEGIPLALELAAARMQSLSVGEINKRLNDRFRILTGGSRVALERQQTMRALVTWSYDLLSEQERILLERLSIFAGGFDLGAAAAVCNAAPLSTENVLDLLTSLVAKSLVLARQQEGESRYSMLETIRDFAREQLIERNDLDATAARHFDYYLEFAKQARVELHGSEQAKWTHQMEAELDNMRTAIALAGSTDPVNAVKFEVALMRFRTLRGYSAEGRKNLRAALALPAIQEHALARAHALYTAAVLALNQSDYGEAEKMLCESLAIRRTLMNEREIAATLSTMGTVYLEQDEATKARDCEEEALEIFRELDDRLGESIALITLGGIAVRQGDCARAEMLFEESLAIAQSLQHKEQESECERSLGDLALRARNLGVAAARFSRSLEICRNAEDKRGEAITMWYLARIAAARGERDSARVNLESALRAFRSFGMNAEALGCLEDYAELLRAAYLVEDAVRLLAAVLSIRKRLGITGPKGIREGEASGVEAARGLLGTSIFEAAWSTGARWTLEEAIKHALGA